MTKRSTTIWMMVVLFVVALWACETSFAGHIAAWGWNKQGQCNVPEGNDFVAVAGGTWHSLALRSDGSLIAWGSNGSGQCNVPNGNNFVAIAAGVEHSLALKSDSSIVGWGSNHYGETNIPDGNDFVAIVAGAYHNLALKSDGSIVGWGRNDEGQVNVPEGNDFVAIDAGGYYNLALRSDGSLVAWEANVKGVVENVPAGNDFVAIAAGGEHCLALKADSSVIGWGPIHATLVPLPNYGFKAIAAGGNFCLALKCDGSIVGWGHNEDGQIDVPTRVKPGGTQFIAIAGGASHSLGIYECPLSADLTGDCYVDMQDLQVWVDQWLSRADQLDTDLERDNAVEDFATLADEWLEDPLWPAPLIDRKPMEWYVTPDGSPCGYGSQESPWDLPTAFCNELVKPGDTVWVDGGTYYGPFFKPANPSGTEDAPIIYRVKPGEWATLTADKTNHSVLTNQASYVWFWGFEVTVDGAPELGDYGTAVNQDVGTGFKYINVVVHDCPNRRGFAGVSIGGEFYGCISYRNGRWSERNGHGFSFQNRPVDVGGSVDDLPWKEFRDCVAFDNYGAGFMHYGSSPQLANILWDGCVSFGNGRLINWIGESRNFRCGGRQRDDNFVMRECFTYFPPEPGTKAPAIFAFAGPPDGKVIVENNVLAGGANGTTIYGWEQVIFRDNTCYTATGDMLDLGTLPDVSQYNIDDNKYYHPPDVFIHMDGAHYETLEAWQAATGWDMNSTHIVGRPSDVWVYLRPNKYEPDRAHLIFYNWPKTETVSVELAKLWGLENGPQYEYRVVNVEDIWGEPVAEGTLNNGAIEVPMTGVYAPEFACYLVTRRVP